ncbi:acetyl-CoA carboxylase, carboxyltransferase subunit beta [bacterium]
MAHKIKTTTVKTVKKKFTHKKKAVPFGLWTKCSNCQEIIYNKELDQNYKVCPKCNFYFRMNVWERINLFIEKNTFKEYDKNLSSSDPLEFFDTKAYKDRLKSSIAKTNRKEAVVTGIGKMGRFTVVMGVLDFEFMGGSMGSVVGEKITRAIEQAVKEKAPVIVVSSSGGARMQESMLSLMQMAKTSAALAKVSEAGLPYISVLTDPTTGGVTASFAMLGDIHIAEPNALIAFAGPRVIEQTIRQQLPKGFQRSEFQMEHGMVDMIVDRKELKSTLINLLDIITPAKKTTKSLKKKTNARKKIS